MSRKELAERASAMRSNGGTAREIAAVLGISRSYASALYSDPEGSKDRARKARYSSPCPDCGQPMSGCNGRGETAPKVCAGCARARQHANRRWTRATIVAAIRAWADEHGAPPTANDWLHADPEGRWPNRGSVYNDSSYGYGYPAPFARWADAIEAAGFPRPRTGARPNDPHWTPNRVIEQLRELSRDGIAPSSSTTPVLQKYAHQFFGSWFTACAAAGIRPRRNPRTQRVAA